MKRLPKENEYQLDIKDQFKNEFEIGQLQGNNFHMTDSADLPMYIEPQGNIEQEVIEAVEGIVVEGSSINVSDVDTTKESKISINGGIEQDSREGYQLLEPIMESATSNGVTCTNNGDGTFTLNGTPTARTTFRLDQRTGDADNLKNYDDGDYELSLGVTNSNLRLVLMQNNTWTSFLILPVNTEKYHAPITNATDCFIYVDVLEGATFNNVVIEPMFRKYNNDNKPFEQYGAMPSLDFPSEVKGVGSEEDINILENKLTTKTNGGVTFTKNKDGSVSYDGISTGSYSLCYADLNMENIFEEGKTYYINANGTSNKVGLYVIYRISGEYIGAPLSIGSNEVKWVVPSGITQVFIRAIVFSSGVDVTGQKIYPQISTKNGLSYTPYGYCRYETVVGNKNIYHANIGFEKGYLKDGNVAAASGWKVTDYIKIPDNVDVITLLNGWGKFETHCFYNENKEYVGFYMMQTNETNAKIPLEDNYKYVRFTVSEVYKENFMIAFGDTNTFIEHQEQTLPIDIPINKEIFDKTNYNVLNRIYFNLTDKTALYQSILDDVKSIYIPCEENKTYDIYKISSSKFTIGYTKQLPAIGVQAFNIMEKTTATHATITTGAGAKYLVIYLYYTDTDTTITFEQIVNSISIKERYGLWYSGKPYKENGKWYRENKYLEKTLDETISIDYWAEQGDYVLFQHNIYKVMLKAYCDKLKFQENWGTDNNVESIYIGGSTLQAIQIKILKSRLSVVSANGIKQWLGENNLKVVYELETPLEPEEITDETLIAQLEALYNAEFYEGVTNINSYRSSEDVAEMPLEAHYNFITPSPSVERPSEVLEVGSEEDINLYNIGDVEETTQNGVTYSIKNGKFKANGKATASFTIITTNTRFDLKSGDYTFGVKNIKGTYSGTVGKYVTKPGGTNVIDGDLIDRIVRKTLTEDYLDLYASIYVNNGSVFNDYETDLMVVKGSYMQDTLPPFTPYGYCRYENVVENKNLWKPALTSNGSNILQIRCTVDLNEDEYTFTATGADMYFGNVVQKGLPYINTAGILYEVKNKKNVVITSTNSEIKTILITIYDENKISLEYRTVTRGVPITLHDDAKYFSFRLGNLDSIAGTVYKTKIQLEYDVATPYTPHLQQTFPIDLPIGMKMYNDEFFYKENGKWWRSINYVKSKLTSDMNWYLEVFDGIGRPRTEDFANIIKNVSAVNTVRVYSNYFKQNYGSTDYVFGNLKVGYLGFYTNKQLYLTTYFKNVNDWKTYLDQNDVYIVFEIEPYPEEITDANLIAQLEKTLTPFSYYPVTNINSYRPTTNVADLKLYAEYFKSNKITNK